MAGQIISALNENYFKTFVTDSDSPTAGKTEQGLQCIQWEIRISVISIFVSHANNFGMA